MTTVRPLGTRVVGILWLVAGVVLIATGLVVVIDQHDLLRWEFLAGLAVLPVGVQAGSRSVTVDAHGIEERAGRHRQRLLWSTVDRVAVGVDDRHGGPVTVWRAGATEPVVLRGSWGTTRAQRRQLVTAVRDAVGPHGVTVTSDVDDAPSTDEDPPPPPPGTAPDDPADSTWTARGPADA